MVYFGQVDLVLVQAVQERRARQPKEACCVRFVARRHVKRLTSQAPPAEPVA